MIMNSTQLITQHYNAKNDSSNRNDSSIINIRRFNNWIKIVMFSRYVAKETVCIDLACGKGGDLGKWNQCNITSLLCIDIADNSIIHATKRLKEFGEFAQKVQLRTADCFTKKLLEDSDQCNMFDVCSMQFALHYSFETEEKARNLLQNISDGLKKDGIFMGTIPNEKKILDASQNEKKNEFYTVRKVDCDVNYGDFGQAYWFYLKDAVDCLEFLVPFTRFVGLAQEYNLTLESESSFAKIYEEEIAEDKYRSDRRSHLRKLFDDQISSEKLTCEDWSCIMLYRAFVFRKR